MYSIFPLFTKLLYLHTPKRSKFRSGDRVFVRTANGLQGPYYIAAPPTSAGKYVLSHANGQLVWDGQEIDEANLEFA